MANAPGKFRVGLVQMSMSPDPQANLDKAAARVEEAARAAGLRVVMNRCIMVEHGRHLGW